jgi:integrase
MLLYNTGLRVGELCALSREDVRLPAEGWGALQVVGKGRRLHRLPINRPAADALLAYLSDRDDVEPALFLNRNGDRFSVRGIALLVNRYLGAAGTTHRSGPHLLRHTFMRLWRIRHPRPASPAQSAGGPGAAGPRLGDDNPALHPPGGRGSAGPGRRSAGESLRALVGGWCSSRLVLWQSPR